MKHPMGSSPFRGHLQLIGSIDLEAAQREILEAVSQSIHLPVNQINLHKAFSELPLDSLDTINLLATIEGIIQQELPPNVLTQVACLSDVFAIIRDHLAPV